MKVILIIVLIVVNIPIYKYLFNVFFEGIDDFKESLRYLLKPDIISLFEGEYWKDRGHEFKLALFIFSCVVIVWLEYVFVSIILG